VNCGFIRMKSKLRNKSINNFYGLLVISIVLLAYDYYYAIIQAYHGDYIISFPDAYMRMVKVLELVKTNNFYDHFLTRSNFPWGTDTHYWTRALDILLLVGSYFLTLFYPFKKALWLWAFVLPILFKILSIPLFIWSFKPFNPSRQQVYYLLLAFLTNPFISQIYWPLRVDYNFLSVTLFITFLGFYFRLIAYKEYKYSIALGLLFAFGSWVSLAFFIICLLSLSYLVFLWIREPATYRSLIDRFAITSLIACFCFIVIEHSPFWQVNYDTLALNYWLILFVGYLMLIITDAIEFSFSNRCLFFIGLLWFAAFIATVFFPAMTMGPYAATDNFIRNYFFPSINEFQPPFRVNFGFGLACLINFFLASIVLIYSLYKRMVTHVIASLALVIFILGILTAYMYRWSDYGQIVFIYGVALCIPWFYLPEQGKKSIAAYLLIILFALLPNRFYTTSEWRHDDCTKLMFEFIRSPYLNSIKESEDALLFAPPNFTPYLLYFTSFNVVAGNYHRNKEGLKDAYRFFYSTDISAWKIVEKRNVNYLLFCRRDIKKINKLSAGKLTYQFKSLTIPAKYNDLVLYKKHTTENNKSKS
jgi:hypothetical protein